MANTSSKFSVSYNEITGVYTPGAMDYANFLRFAADKFVTNKKTLSKDQKNEELSKARVSTEEAKQFFKDAQKTINDYVDSNGTELTSAIFKSSAPENFRTVERAKIDDTMTAREIADFYKIVANQQIIQAKNALEKKGAILEARRYIEDSMVIIDRAAEILYIGGEISAEVLANTNLLNDELMQKFGFKKLNNSFEDIP